MHASRQAAAVGHEEENDLRFRSLISEYRCTREVEAKRTNHEYNVIFRGREKKKKGDSEIEDRRRRRRQEDRRVQI